MYILPKGVVPMRCDVCRRELKANEKELCEGCRQNMVWCRHCRAYYQKKAPMKCIHLPITNLTDQP